MREHPIPQDITNYRFHIVGSMTLKQFGEVAVGVMLAFILYVSGLPKVIAIPLGLLSVAIGAGAAFVPYQQRPLDHWIITYVKLFFKPTQFYWKRAPFIPPVFEFKPQDPEATVQPDVDLSPARRQRIKEYLQSLNSTSGSEASADPDQARYDSIMTAFDQLPTGQGTLDKNAKPHLKVRLRKLRPLGEIDIASEPSGELDLQSTTVGQVGVDPSQVAQDIDIPAQAPRSSGLQTIIEESEQVVAGSEDENNLPLSYAEPQVATASDGVTFNSNLPFPSPPSEPNKLVGMVLSNTNDLITDAVVQITTQAGHIARAVKTNALGQFFITTPLAPGDYVVTVEKEGFAFESLGLHLENNIIAPIEIRGDPTS